MSDSSGGMMPPAGTSAGPISTAGAHQRPLSWPEEESTYREQNGPGAWYGWIMFAATMLLLLGMFHAFQGLVALFRDEYYVVGQNNLTLHVDYTGWGWTHLIFGLVLVAVAIGMMYGKMWARVIGVLLAVLSALLNVAFLAAYPIWSTIMIAFDVLVIWALCVHGDVMRVARRS